MKNSIAFDLTNERKNENENEKFNRIRFNK